MRKSLVTAAIALCLGSFAFGASAQGPGPKPGTGPGPGGGPGMQGGGCCSAETTPGWGMMSPDERTWHHNKIKDSKDYAGCHAYLDEHHKAMQERAKQRGTPMPRGPGGAGAPGPACDFLKK